MDHVVAVGRDEEAALWLTTDFAKEIADVVFTADFCCNQFNCNDARGRFNRSQIHPVIGRGFGLNIAVTRRVPGEICLRTWTTLVPSENSTQEKREMCMLG